MRAFPVDEEFRAPALLVSVRTPAEAARAAAGGADIVDIKEPFRGPLGRADAATIENVAIFLADAREPALLSVALGELREWDWNRQGIAPEPVVFAKLGLAGMAQRTGWIDDWVRARAQFDQLARRPLQWVAVAYADQDAAASPAVDDILCAASRTGCAGLLIDTFDKHSGGLLDYFQIDDLRRKAREAHAAGLFLAVAGKLSVDDLQRLPECGCDIAGVRTAACEQGERRGSLSRARVTACRAALTRGERAAPVRIADWRDRKPQISVAIEAFPQDAEPSIPVC